MTEVCSNSVRKSQSIERCEILQGRAMDGRALKGTEKKELKVFELHAWVHVAYMNFFLYK